MRARANAAAANGCRRQPECSRPHGPRACDVRHGTYSGRTAAPELRGPALAVATVYSCMLQNTCHGMRHVACCIDRRDVLSHSSRQPPPATVQAPHRRKSKQQTLVHSRPEWLPQSGRLDSAVGCARHSSRHMNGYCIHTRIYSDHCLGPPLFVRTAAADFVSARRTLIVRRVGRHIRLPSNPAQAAVGLVNATPTSARGLDAPLPLSAPGLGCHAKYRNQSRRQAHRTAGCCRCAALRRVASEIDRGGVARLISHWIGSLRAEQVEGLCPVPVQMWQRCAPVPVQMWDGRAQSRCRCCRSLLGVPNQRQLRREQVLDR
jgi:hypothetical protein